MLKFPSDYWASITKHAYAQISLQTVRDNWRYHEDFLFFSCLKLFFGMINICVWVLFRLLLLFIQINLSCFRPHMNNKMCIKTMIYINRLLLLVAWTNLCISWNIYLVFDFDFISYWFFGHLLDLEATVFGCPPSSWRSLICDSYWLTTASQWFQISSLTLLYVTSRFPTSKAPPPLCFIGQTGPASHWLPVHGHSNGHIYIVFSTETLPKGSASN